MCHRGDVNLYVLPLNIPLALHMNKTSKARKLIVGTAWVAFFSLPLWWFYTWDPFDASVTRLSHYKTSRNEIPSVLVQHFPTDLPKDNVWYFYSPGPLQANPAMQLLLKPPAEQIDRIYDEMSRIAMDHYVAYDFDSPAESEYEMRSGEPMWVFAANGIERPYPNKNDHYFVTYIGNGSEPAEAGVCINRTLGTVVYYCDLGKHNTFDTPADAAEQRIAAEP